jgi:protein-S-isoprenylcysteine O-methyltransferase Ste14
VQWLELKVPPPVVALLLGAAAWWLAPQGPAMAWPDGVRQGLAAALLLTGVSLDFSGLVAFVRRHTTINPLRPRRSTALVTGGVYRFTRNPMYLGLAVLLSAWAVWLAALLPWLAPLAFVFYITRFQIQPEERVLSQLFGPPYTDYTRRVRRWL